MSAEGPTAGGPDLSKREFIREADEYSELELFWSLWEQDFVSSLTPSESAWDDVWDRISDYRRQRGLRQGGAVDSSLPFKFLHPVTAAQNLARVQEAVNTSPAIEATAGEPRSLEEVLDIDMSFPEMRAAVEEEYNTSFESMEVRKERSSEQMEAEAKSHAAEHIRGLVEDLVDDVDRNAATVVRAIWSGIEEDAPNVDEGRVLRLLNDIEQEFGSDFVDAVLRGKESEIEDRQGGFTQTRTDAQGRPIRETADMLDAIEEQFADGGVEAILQDVTDTELEKLASEIRGDGVTEAEEDDLRSLFRSVDDRTLGAAVEESDGLYEVLFALNAPIPPPPLTDPGLEVVEVPEEELESAVESAESALEPTAGRGVDYFQQALDVLESREAEFGVPITQDELSTLSTAEHRRLVALAEQRLESAIVRRMDPEDFPDVQRALERATGRTVAGYWQPLLDELESDAPSDYDILRSEGVPADQLELLAAADEIRSRFRERVQENIEGIRRQRGGGEGGVGDLEDLQDIEGAGRERPGESQLTDFQQKFLQLARDLGREKNLPRKPERYFGMSESQQRRRHDFTPQGFLNFWVMSGFVTRDELRDRDFPPETIPPEDL